MNVHLAVPDLIWPDRDTRAAADPGRLAALEMLMARGRRSPSAAGGLEEWLLAAWGTAGPAPHALVADGGTPGDDWWLRADPCSLRLNRETVVPLDAAMFELSRAEADALVEHLNRNLADRGLVFHGLQPERWYLQTATPLGEDAPPLAAARGRAVEVHPGAGGGEARLHALANEIQMLLHDHPVNEARERRGEPPVNAVWLWGGGRLARTAARPFQRVRTHDPLAAGLALGSGAAVLPLPDDAERWLHASGNDGVELIVLDALGTPAAYGDAATWRERLAALELDWFAPLAGALRHGSIGMVTLHAIGPASALDVETTRQDLRYFWRRPRPLASYARQ
jgi:hypothetical protein